MEREAKGLPLWGTATDAYRARQNEERRLKRIEDRAALGLPAYGSGLRNPRCSVCGEVKDCKQSGYCSACKRDAARDRRLEKKAANPNFAVEEREKRNERLERDELHRFKVAARVFTMRAINQGMLIRKPCEVCGLEKVDAHHDDYTKPLEVRWLCRKHHLEHHRNVIIKET
jgi:hypothetical protein